MNEAQEDSKVICMTSRNRMKIVTITPESLMKHLVTLQLWILGTALTFWVLATAWAAYA